MTRSTSTGLYTRLSNSFSQPVTGTTIDPTDADSYFDDIDEAMNSFIGTSTTSLTIGTGSKTFTTQLTKAFVAGTFIQAMSQADHTNYMYGTVTSYTAATGALVCNITTTGGSGTLADWLIMTSGGQGTTGATGATGYTAGIRQAYSSTTTDSDPGAGTFRLNNATPASATAAYLDNVDSGGSTVSTIFDLFDDSTTTTKGFIRFEKSGDPTVWAQFAVTGSVVDGTGYRKLTLSSGAGSGAFTNTDVFAISFYRSGDKGADGAGTGDFSSNTASSVDGEMLLFSGTGGKTGKRSTLTGGLLKSTSGVPAIAAAGTDYCAATSGSSVLKGSSGNTAAATAGTDYMHPGTTSLITIGFTVTPNNIGTVSSGTTTPAAASGNYQYLTNNGAFTLAAPAADCAIDLLVTNGASAGSITFSGYTVSSSTGDALTTTNTSKFIISIRRINSVATYTIKALQ